MAPVPPSFVYRNRPAVRPFRTTVLRATAMSPYCRCLARSGFQSHRLVLHHSSLPPVGKDVGRVMRPSPSRFGSGTTCLCDVYLFKAVSLVITVLWLCCEFFISLKFSDARLPIALRRY